MASQRWTPPERSGQLAALGLAAPCRQGDVYSLQYVKHYPSDVRNDEVLQQALCRAFAPGEAFEALQPPAARDFLAVKIKGQTFRKYVTACGTVLRQTPSKCNICLQVVALPRPTNCFPNTNPRKLRRV